MAYLKWSSRTFNSSSADEAFQTIFSVFSGSGSAFDLNITTHLIDIILDLEARITQPHQSIALSKWREELGGWSDLYTPIWLLSDPLQFIIFTWLCLYTIPARYSAAFCTVCVCLVIRVII